MKHPLLTLVLAAGLVAPRLHAGGPRQTISLEQAYDKTLESDQTIRTAWYEIQKAALQPLSALTRMGPRLTGSASYDKIDRTTATAARIPVPSTTPAATTASTATTGLTGAAALTAPAVTPATTSVINRSFNRRDSGQVGLTLEQPLLDLTVFPAYKVGKLVAESARLQYRFTVRDVLFGVAAAYYDVLEQQRIVAVDRETVGLAGNNLDLAQKRADAGEVLRADVLRATATVEADKRALIESENLLESKLNKLANILNLDTARELTVTEPPDHPPGLPKFEDVVIRAYERREDLQAQALAVQQDVFRRREIKAEYAPKVSAQLSALANDSNGPSASHGNSWEAALSVAVPFMTGGQRAIDLKTAEYQINQTQLAYDKLKKSIQEEVKDAWLAVRALTETLKALRVQVEANRQSYEDLQNQYESGAATSLDVLTALNALDTAQKDLAVQTYAYQLAQRKLEQASGTFQEPRIRKIAQP